MAGTLDEVREDAMQLGMEERGALGEELLGSLRTDEDREIEREWIEVAERRLDEIHAGTAVTYPIEEVIARVREKLRAETVSEVR